jgi:lipopolysaccharide/colanic/teichoic acid biosynthesis glycosyltransferase
MFQSGKCRPERRRVWRSSSFFQSLGKRGVDVFVATAGLLLLSPLILLVSLSIRIDSCRPVLRRCKRYNSNNVEFEIFEFRTTSVNQNEMTFNCGGDETRCTTGFGRLLRRSGINKLPLLFSVLSGEISIVGSHLFAAPPGSAFLPLDLRGVRPGLVSWADAHDDQIMTADAAKSIYLRIKCDRYYVDNISFLFDMKIILNTLLSKRILLPAQM